MPALTTFGRRGKRRRGSKQGCEPAEDLVEAEEVDELGQGDAGQGENSDTPQVGVHGAALGTGRLPGGQEGTYTEPASGMREQEDDNTSRQHLRERVRLVSSLAACSVLLSWLVGVLGWSLAWLLLFLAAAALFARSSVEELLETAVRLETRRVHARRALAQDETAEWFNFLLNRWWMFSSSSLFALLKERLEPLLNESRPSIVESLELRQLCLGSQTPVLRGLRASELVGGRCVPLTLRSLALSPLSPRHQVALQAHVELHPADDFRCVLRTRLFGKGVGVDLDMAMEKLHMSGNVLTTFTLDLNAPFPHITQLSVTFLEKPDVWFSVRLLKSVQAMEVPLLKTWIHSLVMDALVTSLVDPGHFDVMLMPPDCPAAAKDSGDPLAHGVITVTLNINQAGPVSDEARWFALTIGEQRHVTSHISPHWSESASFLVSALQTDRLLIKLKAKRLVGALTVAQFELPLAAYNLETTQVVDTLLHKKQPPRTSVQLPVVGVRLEYSPLAPVQLDQPEPIWSILGSEPQGGVLYVVIHGAEGLASSDQNECNPYCMLFNNRQKVKTTHYLRGVSAPQWESRTQLLVSDFSQASLSFVVCSWSSSKMADTDLLGVAVLSLHQGDRWIVRRQLALTGNTTAANITVSVVFQAVASVCGTSSRSETTSLREKDKDRPASPGSQLDFDDMSSFNRGKRNSNTWMQQAKMLLTHKDSDSCVSDISNLLSNGQGLVEVSLIRARDLMSKDLNGFSDPYCELKVNGECKYKSSIKKKTLNPTWEESAITGMPRLGDTLDIVIWDHDVFGMKDFLGSVTLGLDDIRRYSVTDIPQWFQLHGVKTGQVEIKVKIISEMEVESGSSYSASINSCTSSPRLPLKNDSDRDSVIRRPSLERSRLRLHMDHVPPPPPPRTVTLKNRTTFKEDSLSFHNGNGSLDGSLENGHHNGHSNGNSWSPAQSSNSSPLSVPRVMVTSARTNATESPSKSSLQSLRPSISPPSLNEVDQDLDVNADASFKKSNEYSSLRIMKQKVKQGLRLRRFRSEINVHDEKNGRGGCSGVALSMEPRGAGEADATELLQGEPLSHAVSQPSLVSIKHKRPTELKGLACPRPDTYVGVEGRVLQAQGLHVAHVAQLYCRVKLQATSSPDKLPRATSSNAAGKTVAKSRLLPAVPNPRFELPFQLDCSSPIPRQAGLLFEIRSTSKDVVASRRITLQDLLSAAAPDTNEVHTWLALNNGASLEVEVAHGRELKKPTRKIFRSWSVHRIGKI